MTTTKKKLNRADYMFQNKTGEELMKKPGDVNGLDFAIRDLKDCTVFLLDHTAQIFVDDCENCTMVIGPVKGSIFVRNCTNCKISVPCQQFRCRDLKDCTIFLYVANEPVIESSQNLVFAPFNAAYPFLDQQVATVGFDVNDNKWELIFDFTKDESGQKLNFSLLDPSQFQIVSKSIEGVEQKPVLAFPYPQRYGGVLSDDANAHHQSKNEGVTFNSVEQMKKDAQELAQLKQEQKQEELQQQQQQHQDDPIIMDHFGGDSQVFNSYQPQLDSHDDFELFEAAGTSQPVVSQQNTFQNQFQSNSSPYQQQQQQQQEFPGQGFNSGSQMSWQNNDFQSNSNDFSIPSYSAPGQQQTFVPPMYQAQNNGLMGMEFDGEDLDEEERERILQSELTKQEQLRSLYFKQEEEQKLKQQRKTRGREELLKWSDERQQQLKQRAQSNKQLEQDYHTEQQRLKETTNQWERIMSNVEINSSQYVGSWDVTRMRQAMIARKSDITKGNAATKKSIF